MTISAKVAARIASQLKSYKSILAQAMKRDCSEGDTADIVRDMISDILGYDKYQHLTAQHPIHGAFADLLVGTDEKPRFLVEVKAIGSELKDSYIRQVVDYAANKGVEWVVLTNAALWRVYKVIFAKPIDRVLVCELDAVSANPKGPEVIECFGNLSFEAFSKDTLSDWFHEKQITSKFSIAALLLSDASLNSLRLQIKRLSGVRVDIEDLRERLTDDVIKRDLIDGEDANSAASLLKKLQRRMNAKRSGSDDDEGDAVTEEAIQPPHDAGTPAETAHTAPSANEQQQ